MVGTMATNSPGEEILSTSLDVLLPLIYFTDLTIKGRMSLAVTRTGHKHI